MLDLRRKSGDAPCFPLHLKKDRGTYLYMLHCIQGVQGTGKDNETDEVSIECGQSPRNSQDHTYSYNEAAL